MNQYVIEGGKRLRGELQIGTCKNAVLPIIAATLLNEDITYLKKCPKISDVFTMIGLLKELGCQIEWKDETLIIDTRNVTSTHLDEELVKEMRSSIILLGALMGRKGEAHVCTPGGCKLGDRPIEMHIDALKKMNIEITNSSDDCDHIDCKTTHLKGAIIDNFKLPSVGATQNVMLAAVRADGVTIIHNAAKEPEIVDLQNFLRACGAKIKGAGTDTITIEGVQKLHGVRYQVMSDRIVAGTYLVAAAITRGSITLKNVHSDQMKSTLDALKAMGCKIKTRRNSISLKCPNELNGIDLVTAPFPDFPTDMQSQFLALLCTCQGTNSITETLFNSRFGTADELKKMGANIEVRSIKNEDGKYGRNKEVSVAQVGPGNPLHGAWVHAPDLRGGAALVLAALAAEGTTVVDHIDYIQRGYQNIVEDLKKLGANIQEMK